MPSEMQDRKSFLGGSDIAGVLGLSRWKTPLSVWAEKTGQIVSREEEEPLYKKLGKRLEEVVAELFTEKTGLRVQRANERRVHPKFPMFAAQIDRLIVGYDEILECKTSSAWKAKEWVDEEIPADYTCQAMWQLAVTGRKRVHVAVLIGNQDFLVKVVERDPVMIAEMLKRAESFWNDFVIPQVMPGQVTSGDTATLAALFPYAEVGKETDLGDQGAQLVEMRASLWQDRYSLEKQIEKLENDLKALLKDAETGQAGKWRVTWKNMKRKAYSVEAKEYRRFDIRPVKEA